jgi:hypothetical protein
MGELAIQDVGGMRRVGHELAVDIGRRHLLVVGPGHEGDILAGAGMTDSGRHQHVVKLFAHPLMVWLK